MLDTGARQADLQQARRALGNDHLLMRRDVVAVRVRNERETFGVPRIEPEILLRQVNASLVANFDHAKNYFRIRASSTNETLSLAH
jgi:hypothetical protein